MSCQRFPSSRTSIKANPFHLAAETLEQIKVPFRSHQPLLPPPSLTRCRFQGYNHLVTAGTNKFKRRLCFDVAAKRDVDAAYSRGKNKSAARVFNPAAPERSAHVYRKTKPLFFVSSEESISILNFGGLYSLVLSLRVLKTCKPPAWRR